VTQAKSKNKVLQIRLDEEEQQMVMALKKSPHCLNMSQFIRSSIRHLHEKRIGNKK